MSDADDDVVAVVVGVALGVVVADGVEVGVDVGCTHEMTTSPVVPGWFASPWICVP